MFTVLGILFIIFSLSIKHLVLNPTNKIYMPYFKGLFLTGIAMVVLSPIHMVVQLLPIIIYGIWALYYLDNLIEKNELSA